MSALVWDAPGTRTYETGIDRAVLYTPTGLAIPWNGLTSIDEKFDKASTPVYFDGRKISDQVELGDYAATIKAITYPPELMMFEGYGTLRDGVYLADQKHRTFDLCYRTLVGNDLNPNPGYKIHVVYNVTIVPKDVTYATVADSADFSEFEWDITAVPEETDFYRPTAHIIFDSTEMSEASITSVEELLYGTESTAPSLPPLAELIEYVGTPLLIRIVDNGDGTFTASSDTPGIIVLGATYMDPVTINEANVTAIDADSYLLSDTSEGDELSDVTFVDNLDGTWTASTPDDSLITVTADGVFMIQSTKAVFLNPYTWRVTS